VYTIDAPEPFHRANFAFWMPCKEKEKDNGWSSSTAYSGPNEPTYCPPFTRVAVAMVWSVVPPPISCGYIYKSSVVPTVGAADHGAAPSSNRIDALAAGHKSVELSYSVMVAVLDVEKLAVTSVAVIARTVVGEPSKICTELLAIRNP